MPHLFVELREKGCTIGRFSRGDYLKGKSTARREQEKEFRKTGETGSEREKKSKRRRDNKGRMNE